MEDGQVSLAHVRSNVLLVLIFCHGMYACPGFYATYCENAASNGYVVIAPYHTDGSGITFSVGDHRIEFESHPLKNYSDPVLLQKEFVVRSRQMRQRVQNVQFILDRLDELRDGLIPECFLNGKLASVGIAGHSYGGCTALASCLAEPKRVTCGLSLDGWYFPLRDCDQELRVPFFCIHSQFWQWRTNLEIAVRLLLKSRQQKHTFLHCVKGSRHQEYVIELLFSLIFFFRVVFVIWLSLFLRYVKLQNVLETIPELRLPKQTA